MLAIYNTHPDFFWLTNYLESVLSSYLWKPMTSATVARHYRLLLDRYAGGRRVPTRASSSSRPTISHSAA